jgi:CHAT domain-containing protein/tetratricopeptide (TPR) repeat protein
VSRLLRPLRWLASFGALALQPLPVSPEILLPNLEPGQEIEVRLGPGETRSFKVKVEAGEVLQVQADQHGHDIDLRWIVDGREMVRIESGFGPNGPEELLWPSSLATRGRLVVVSRETRIRAQSGWAALRRVDVPASTVTRRQASGLVVARRAPPLVAADLYESLALDHGVAHDWERRAHYLQRAGVAATQAGDPKRGERLLRQSLQIFQDGVSTSLISAHDSAELPVEPIPYAEPRLRFDLGMALYSLDREAAGQSFRQAVASGGFGALTARAYQGLASSQYLGNQMEEACENYEKSRQLYWQERDIERYNKTTLYLGRCLITLGDRETAKEWLDRALLIAQQGDDRTLQIDILRELGLWFRLEGRLDEALIALKQAETMGRTTALLRALAELHLARGDNDRAIELFEQVVEEVNSEKDSETWRVAQASLCQGYAQSGRPEGREACRKALELQDAEGWTRSFVLYQMAVLEHSLGEIEKARASLAEALRLIEKIRSHTNHLETRQSFRATRHAVYDLAIRLDWEDSNLEEGAIAALERFETTRTRSLMELLADRGYLATERGRKAYEAMQSGIGNFSASSLPGILGERTTLLAIHLAEPYSMVWLVRAGEKPRAFQIAGATEVAQQVQDWLPLLGDTANDHLLSNERNLAGRLAEKLLAPIVEHLVPGDRLVVVTDGILQTIPFAALPMPVNGRRMVEEHEVVMLPSLAVLEALRYHVSSRPATQDLVAMVGDPIYAGQDDRAIPGSGDLEGETPQKRLKYSGEELAAIVRAAGAGKVRSFVEWDARRESILGGELRGHRIVHFATHGEGGRQPRLFLSQVSREGRRQRGALSLEEISGLELDADLAVLSACSSGIGEDVPGEGLIGLTRGFMEAGVPSVVVSLWNVQDRGTARFMGLFYDALLRRGESPAAALRAAQLAEIGAGKSPTVWAAFVLQGDWLSHRLGCTKGGVSCLKE